VHFLLTERVKGAEIHHVSYFVPLLMCKWMYIPTFLHQQHWFSHSNILIHSYILCCRWYFYPNWADNRWISAPSVPLYAQKNTLQHVAYSRCKPLVEHSSLCHAFLAQIDYIWTTLAAYYHLVLSHGMTWPQQCFHSYRLWFSSLIGSFQHFGKTYHLCLQGRRWRWQVPVKCW
jgi:hypothetical protein